MIPQRNISLLSNRLAREGGRRIPGMDLTDDHSAAALWDVAHQSFSLARWVGENKFGPHFVTGKTPISNIRLTTFFAGENEVRIIDPDLVEFGRLSTFSIERCSVPAHREASLVEVDARGSDSLPSRLLV